MRFLRRHWYTLGLPIAIIALAWGLMSDLTKVQWILLLNFVVLLLHQFEEYGWPGGEPWIINEVMQPKGSCPDRYPLNQNNAFFINVPLAWSFYLIPVFFPAVIWVGLAPVVFGFGQFLAHGIANNRKLKALYNPGLAAVLLGHIPLGIWYLRVVHASWRDWALAILYVALFIVVGMLKVGYGLLADENSAYPFAQEEMERFGRRRRLARVRGACESVPPLMRVSHRA